MTSEVMSADYGAFALTGVDQPLSRGYVLLTDVTYGSWGVFALTGFEARFGGLWLPVVNETLFLRETFGFVPSSDLADGWTFGDSATTEYSAGAAIIEALGLNASSSTGALWSQLVADHVSISQALALALEASCGETLTLSQTASLALAITVAQTLFLKDPVATTLDFNLSVAEALLTNTAFGEFFGADVHELAALSSALSPLWRFGATTGENVTLADVAGGSLLISVTAPEGVEFADAEVLQYIFSPTIAEGVSITAGYVSPAGEFTAWAINTRTTGVTEYRNFSFDSFAQMGRKYIAGNASGLYELDGDTDAGELIIADILSGLMDVGGSKFTSYKAAYLGIKSKGGQFVLKLITGYGETYVYTVTAWNMRSTRVNFGKGLRSRYFRFELINADGADFDLHSIEFLPLVSQRRI